MKSFAIGILLGLVAMLLVFDLKLHRDYKAATEAQEARWTNLWHNHTNR